MCTGFWKNMFLVGFLIVLGVLSGGNTTPLTHHPPALPLQAPPKRWEADDPVKCAFHNLTLEFATNQTPGFAPLTELWEAMQMGPDCGIPSPGTAKRRRTRHGNRRQRSLQATSKQELAGNEYYVDPVHGKDSNPGTESAPFATIGRALVATRTAEDPGTIVLRDGVYALDTPLELSSVDSGLTVTNYAGEEPVISGGVTLEGVEWVEERVGMGDAVENVNNVMDQLNATGPVPAGIVRAGTTPNAAACLAICEKQQDCTSWTWHNAQQGSFANMCVYRTDGYWLAAQQSGHTSGQKFNVYKADISAYTKNPNFRGDFRELFLGSDGNFRRAIRARYPSANLEKTGLWTAPMLGYLPSAQSWLAPTPTKEAEQILITTPARNGTHFPNFGLGIGGPVARFSPPDSFWGQLTPPGGGGSTYTAPSGLVVDPSTWTDKAWSSVVPNETVVDIASFHCGHWGGWAMTATPTTPSPFSTFSFLSGPFQEARGCHAGAEIAFSGVFEELDSPGEWFFNASTSTLYYYFNTSSSSGPSPTNAQPMVASQLKELVRIFGSIEEPVANVTLRGLTFAHTDQTQFEPYTVASGGDWSVYRGGAVHAEGVAGLVVEQCLFRSVGGNGIAIAGYAADTIIRDNEAYFAGDSFIVLQGDTAEIDATTRTQPRNTLVLRNYAYNIGVWGKQVAFLEIAKSAQTNATSNVFFEAPRAAININDDMYGGDFLYRNVLLQCVRETGDHGPINSWNRQVFSDVKPGSSIPSVWEVEGYVVQNILHNDWHSVWPLDQDDGSARVSSSQSLFLWGGGKNYLGREKQWHNHVIVQPDRAHVPPPPISTPLHLLQTHYSTPAAAILQWEAKYNTKYPYPLPSLRNGLVDEETRKVFFSASDGGFEAFFTKPYCMNSDGTEAGDSGWGELFEGNHCWLQNSNSIFGWGNCDATNPASHPLPATANNTYYTPNATVAFKCGSATLNLTQWQQDFDTGSGSKVLPPPTLEYFLNLSRNTLGMV